MHPLDKFHYCPKCGSKQFQQNNFKSKKCNDCGFVYYFNPCAAVAAIIINSKNELLVARRAKDPAKGTLDLPGGFVDMNETAEEAVAREIKEETGLTVTNTKFLFSLPNKYNYSNFEVQTLDLFYECQTEPNQTLEANDDVAESFYIPLKDLIPTDFGLASIQKGIKKLQKNRY